MFVSRGNITDMQVIVGNNRLIPGPPSQLFGVETFRAHVGYETGARKNDLAVLKVRS
jgi:hypothetical protein